MANELDVPRIGPQHQAGSDSLLTGQTFFRMKEMFFEDDIDDSKYCGHLYGLGTNFVVVTASASGSAVTTSTTTTATDSSATGSGSTAAADSDAAAAGEGGEEKVGDEAGSEAGSREKSEDKSETGNSEKADE